MADPSATRTPRASGIGWRVALLGVAVLAVQPAGAPAQVYRWDWASAVTASEFAGVASAEAAGGDGSAVVIAGRFTGVLEFGGVPNPSGTDSYVAVMGRDGVMVWPAPLVASSDRGDAVIEDIAVARDGTIFAGGRFTSELQVAGRRFPAAGEADGFVAWATPGGEWLGAFATGGFEVFGVTVSEGGDVAVTGRGEIARYYEAADIGAVGGVVPAWAATGAGEAVAGKRIEFLRGGDLVVLGETERGTGAAGRGRDVFLSRVDVGTGATVWFRSGGGGAEFMDDEAGGLSVTGEGAVRATFSSGDPAAEFGGVPVPSSGFASTFEAYLVEVRPGGQVAWVRPVARAAGDRAVMRAPDVESDRLGNTAVAVSYSGPFEFEHRKPRDEPGGAGVVVIDGAGERFLSRSGAGGVAVARGLALGRDPRAFYLAGSFGGGGTGAPDYDGAALPGSGVEQGMVVALGAHPDQGRYLVVRDPGSPLALDDISAGVAALGGAPTLAIENPRSGLGVIAAHLTRERAGTLAGEVAGVVAVEEDLPLEPALENSDASWALARLNSEGAVAPAADYLYEFPETCIGVRVYLIDTAVDAGAPFVSGLDPAAVLEPTVVVRALGDPMVSTEFEHGSQMLGLIAGQQTGVAPKSPVVVRNYDVFPAGAGTTTYVSNVTSAVLQAIVHHEGLVAAADGEPVPAVMLLALSSTVPATSATLASAIQQAVDAGIVVVVSAGNSGGVAASYTPASNGAIDGVICAGGFRQSEEFWPASNHGSAVDLLGPAEGVAVPDLAGGLVDVDGTSVAAAMTAGVVALCLATNPLAEPEEIEAFLTSGDQPGALGVPASLPAGTPGEVVHSGVGGPGFFFGYSEWIAAKTGAFRAAGDDFDGDGLSNLREFLHGTDPGQVELGWDGVGVAALAGGGAGVELTFPIWKPLWNAVSATDLLDGSELEFEVSEDLGPGSWATGVPADIAVAGELSPTRLLIRVELPGAGGRQFFRLRHTLAP